MVLRKIFGISKKHSLSFIFNNLNMARVKFKLLGVMLASFRKSVKESVSLKKSRILSEKKS